MQRALVRISLFLLFIHPNIINAESNEVVIYNAEKNWLKFDRFHEAYLPVLADESKQFKSLHLILSSEKFKGNFLKFESTKDLSLFINHQLVFKQNDNQTQKIILPIDSLLINIKGEVIFTFYNPKGKLPINTTSIVGFSSINNTDKEIGTTNLTFIKLKNGISTANFFLFLCLIIAVIIYKKLNPKEANDFFGFHPKDVNLQLQTVTINTPFLWTIAISTLSLALLIFLLKANYHLWSINTSVIQAIPVILGLILLFIFCRLIYTSILAWAFNFSKMVILQNVVYFNVIGKIFFYGSILTYGVLVSSFFKIELNIEKLYYILIVILILALIKVIQLFLSAIQHRNLFLFSYLCASEILPLIISIKLLVF